MRTLNEGVTAERAESVMDDIQEVCMVNVSCTLYQITKLYNYVLHIGTMSEISVCLDYCILNSDEGLKRKELCKLDIVFSLPL